MYQYADLLKNRRSIRNFADEKVSIDVINEILQETCMAPSALNKQPWQFVIIQNQPLMKRISDESKKNLLAMVDVGTNSSASPYRKRLSDPDFNVFYNAPCLVLIVSNNTGRHVHYDLGLAAAYFMFAAITRNLGTCWIGLGDNIQDPALRAELGLTDDYDKIVPLILGYPKQISAMPTRAKPVILKTFE